MTEEEKKAIEFIKKEIKNLEETKIEFSYEIEDKGWLRKNINALDKDIFYKNTLLNLIEKLQKENEKWKENARIAEENDTTLVLDVNQACKELGISEDTIIADELADKIKEKYILKDKIRNFIEKHKYNFYDGTANGCDYIDYEVIKEFIEEE